MNRAKKNSFVALESTVITHGLPHPQNVELARNMEQNIRDLGASPATIAILDGKIRIGLTHNELEQLANTKNPCKLSRRDIAASIVQKATGGTTVAGTMFLAHRAGIKVFATGGIGGVHDLDTMDISTDLLALSDTPMLVVCAGAKAILDLPKTVEYLETLSVPVVGYRTDQFPAFYSRESGIPIHIRLDTPEDIVTLAMKHWEMGMRSAILVCQPLPQNKEIPRDIIDRAIQICRKEAKTMEIHGQKLTPFLLARLAEITHGESVRANLDLLLNNARLAANISKTMSKISAEIVI